MPPPVGMVHWVWSWGRQRKQSGGRSRRPSPQSPKGILGSSSPFSTCYRTNQAKHNRLKTQDLHALAPGKKATARENFPGARLDDRENLEGAPENFKTPGKCSFRRSLPSPQDILYLPGYEPSFEISRDSYHVGSCERLAVDLRAHFRETYLYRMASKEDGVEGPHTSIGPEATFGYVDLDRERNDSLFVRIRIRSALAS